MHLNYHGDQSVGWMLCVRKSANVVIVTMDCSTNLAAVTF